MKRRKFSKYLVISGLGLTGLNLTYVSCMQGKVELRDKPDKIILCSKQTTIVFDKKNKGTVLSFRDNTTGQDFISGDSASKLFHLKLSQAGTSGEIIQLTNQDAKNVSYSTEESKEKKIIRITFSKLGDYNLKAYCIISVDPDDGLIKWHFALEGNESLILEEIHYPIVVLRPQADKEKYNAFVSGINRGGCYEFPDQWSDGKGVFTNQPGSLAAQFGCYYNNSCGFYSATQDSIGFPKQLHFKKTEAGMEYIWKHFCYHDLSTNFELGYAIAQTTFHSQDSNRATDWYDAADIYKSWVLEQPWCSRKLTERNDLPDWLTQGAAMVKFRRKHTYFKPNLRLEFQADRYSHVEEIEGWLKEFYQENFPQVPLIVIFWGWEQVSSWISPKYFPAYPSEEGLRRRVKAVQDIGAHPFFWPSGYKYAVTFGRKEDGTFLFDDCKYFMQNIKPHAVVARGGDLYSKEDFWLDGGTNYRLCRGDKWSRDWLDNISLELTKRGAELIQVDQVNGGCGPGEGGTCYSQLHGHPPGPGSWFVETFSGQLKTIREKCSSPDMKMVMGIEGEQEFFLQQMGIQDYRDFQVYWEEESKGRIPANVYGYLYHEFIPFFQSNPEGLRGKPPGGNMLMMAWCMVNGQIPHLVSHWPLEPQLALKNGDFEFWDENGPTGWNQTNERGVRNARKLLSRDELVKRSGKFSLKIENTDPDKSVRVLQTIGIGEYEREVGGHGPEVGKTYCLKFWHKTEDLSKPGKVSINANNVGGNTIKSWEVPVSQCSNWEKSEIKFTIPEIAVTLQIQIKITGSCKVWFDQFLFEECGEEGVYREVMEKPILEEELALSRKWVQLFHGEGKPYLLFGQMLRPPVLHTKKIRYKSLQQKDLSELPVILHNAFRAPDGSEAVITVNITNQPQIGTLKWDGKDIKLNLLPWEAKLIN